MVFVQIVFRGNQEFRRRVKKPKRVRPLLHQVIRHGDHRLFRQTVLTKLHRRRADRIRFAASYNVVQKRVSACNNSVYRVFLVRAKFDCGIHFGKTQVTSVVLRQANLIEQSVVDCFKFVAPLRIFEYPILKRFDDFILLFPCRNRFGIIQHSFFSAVCVQNRIVNLRRTLIQTVLEQAVCVRSACSENFIYVYRIITARISCPVNTPTAVVFVVVKFYAVAVIVRHTYKFTEKLFIQFFVYPTRSDSDRNIRSLDGRRLHFP